MPAAHDCTQYNSTLTYQLLIFRRLHHSKLHPLAAVNHATLKIKLRPMYSTAAQTHRQQDFPSSRRFLYKNYASYFNAPNLNHDVAVSFGGVNDRGISFS
jgi:hypothetical protein